MTFREQLLACLLALPRPEQAEEWVTPPTASTVETSSTYRQGVYDMLRLLGILHPEQDTFLSPMGYYYVQSLIALITDQNTHPNSLEQAWHGTQGHPQQGLGARLVNTLENYRLSRFEQPTPLRTVAAVMAVIKARRNDQDVFLMQYDDKAEQFQPLGGKVEPEDANEEATLIRELCEELDIPALQLERDLNLQPLVLRQTERKVSSSVQLVTAYEHSFYLVRNIMFPLPTDEFTRWLTLAEIEQDCTTDGLKISSLMRTIIATPLAELPYSIRL